MAPLLTVDDLAALLKTSPANVRQMRCRGELPLAVRIGKRVLWKPEAIDEWVESLPRG